MKTKFYLSALLSMVVLGITNAQSEPKKTPQTQAPFNASFWNAYADKLQLTPAEKLEFINAHKRSVQTNNGNQKPAGSPSPQNTFAGPCINIDFENGNAAGWTTSSGFHPIFNPTGCCPNPGGQQILMSGTANDPAGGFPVVAPGGNFSLRIGNSNTGGEADRIEQTFLVSASNANFTYRYAVVLQDPGHTVAEQPSFQIVMVDSTGAQIPCTYYNVSAGSNIPGFFNSPNLANVVYKPWTSVLVDLTNFIGQNVTIRFTTYDCALGGHYGYAYIDGSCAAFTSGSADTICVGATKTFCAPAGLGTYSWIGPGINNVNGQCLNATAAGVYTCQTTLVTGCTGPQFTYTLSHHPNPTISFNKQSAGPCAQQYTFTNTSSITNGFITSYNWNFGGTGTSTLQNPVANFPGPGTYSVTLTGMSNKGCADTSIQNIAIYPYPSPSFNATSVCQNALMNFNNTSTISIGSIIAHNWNFGNGNSAVAVNPTQTYSNNGSFNVTLSVTSNQGCVASVSNQVTVFPLPVISFYASNVCQGIGTNYFNSSSVPGGNITNYIWDFDNDGIPNSTNPNPAFTYPAAGTYTVNLQAVSNNNCINSATNIAQVYPNPVAMFTNTNVCFGNQSIFNNLSSIAAGGVITSTAWDFGNSTYAYSSSPQFSYTAPGNYVIKLTVTSNQNCVSTFTNSTTIFNLPVVNYSTNVACLNQTTQFNNSTIIPGGTISKWRWDFENDGIWDDTLSVNPTLVYPGFGNYNCKLQATSNNQCISQKINPVVVHANPIANFSTKSTCLGDVTSFTNTSVSLDGIITSNQWDFNGDNNIDNVFSSPTYTYVSNGVYLVKLEVQTSYGCTDVKSKSVYVNPKPITAFSAKNKTGCPSLCTTFTNSSTIATGAIVTTQWLFGDGSLPVYSQNPTHCYGTGNYNVTLKVVSDSGCISSLVQPNFVTVYPVPVAGFKIEPEEVDENQPSVEVKSTASDAVATNYYLSDGSTFGGANFAHTFNNLEKGAPIIFQVVTNQFGCSDTASDMIKVKPGFVVYIPNTFTPNGDGINDGFFAKGVGINKFSIQIYDRWGHLLFETTDINQAWDGTSHGSNEPIKQDVYVWKAHVVDIFNKNHELTGHVSLIK